MTFERRRHRVLRPESPGQQMPQNTTSASSTSNPRRSAGSRQGAITDGAVDVVDHAAAAAHHVVVVVADPQLVEGGSAGGLDAAHDAGGSAVAQHVVDGLGGHGAELGTGGGHEGVGRGVRVRGQRPQHDHPGGRDAQPRRAEQIGGGVRLRHGSHVNRVSGISQGFGHIRIGTGSLRPSGGAAVLGAWSEIRSALPAVGMACGTCQTRPSSPATPRVTPRRPPPSCVAWRGRSTAWRSPSSAMPPRPRTSPRRPSSGPGGSPPASTPGGAR